MFNYYTYEKMINKQREEEYNQIKSILDDEQRKGKLN
jgi:hypothetical protein